RTTTRKLTLTDIISTSYRHLVGHIIQLNPVVSVHEGDSVVLSCFITTKQMSMTLWYKQVTGEQPRLIVSSILHSSKSQFHNEFDSNRFDVLRGTDSFNLTIVNFVQSDWGTYYCAFSFSNIIKFGNGTHLVIKGESVLKLPKIELVKSGVNVPLQCSIQNELERGGGEHRLYWFKHGSEESPPGSIYVHGNTSDGCVGRSEADCLSPTCMYNLPKKKFSSSQTGTYCALATCGEALFGNISKHNPGKCEHLNISDTVGLTMVSFITETINATESNYKQIQTTDDDVSVTEVCQIKLSRFKTTYDIHHMKI
uniref:Novel immune-type receptor 5 n=1 Tax=Sinocyclocheilus grahami TaxID=75366 RepID=A0A672QXH1_SINGR